MPTKDATGLPVQLPAPLRQAILDVLVQGEPAYGRQWDFYSVSTGRAHQHEFIKEIGHLLYERDIVVLTDRGPLDCS